MHDLSIHRSRDLSADAKLTVERMLGRRLDDDEEVIIRALRPHEPPQGEAREQAWNRLAERMDLIAGKTSLPEEEREALVDSVVDETRHSQR
jgi:hypothetical protein